MSMIAALFLSYLLGCFNTGYYLVRWRTGEDVRKHGSGNAGATNAWRVLGAWAFAVALIGDAGKGALAVFLARWLTGGEPWAMALAIPFVVAGHIWPAQLRFRGGEGMATSFGAILALDPLVMGIICLVALVLILVTRNRALVGVVGLLILVPLALYLGRPTAEVVGLLVLLPEVAWAFRRHIRRLFTYGLKRPKST
jgi:glycerol-3-phosphate acyltransferase PlsY